MKNIVIVGFMGTGKSAVAKRLANELGKSYVSVDDLIETREECKISDIFREKGEPYFRKVEKDIIQEVAQIQDQVIDPGGGIVLDTENMDTLEETGIVVCLWATPEIILERIKNHTHRPLLNVNDPLGKIKELLDYRRSFYERAEFHINTDSMDIEEVIKNIKEIIASLEE